MLGSVQSARHKRSIARLGGAGLAAALVLGGAVVAAPGTAWAAAPFSPTSLYGTLNGNNRALRVIDPVTGTSAGVGLTVPGSGTVNQIGVSVDGGQIMLTDGTTVRRYTASTEVWTSVARSTGPSVASTMGGVDPLTGYLFDGGQASGSTFTFARYDPATNTILPGIVTVTAANAPGGNGDLVFDSLGNMYFTAGADTGQLYRADAADLASGTATATPLGGRIAAANVNSIAFGADGYLYVYGGGRFIKVNPVTGGTESDRALSAQLTDLGSRAVPFTATLRSDLPNGQYDTDDAFTITLGGGGITSANTAVTSGTTSAVVGPLLVLPGETYTIKQDTSAGTNSKNYTTTWTCIDAATGEVVKKGTGSSGSFVIPADVKGVSCSFENVALEVTDATDDQTVDNVLGQPVTVTVVDNDGGEDLDPTTVRILDATGTPVTSLVVPDQGTWTVDPVTGAITFTPEVDYLGNPTPVTYTLNDTRGNATQADVAVAYQPVADRDVKRDNPQGQAVVVDVLGNDAGDLDPASVRIVVPGGASVTERVVAGEGTWSVSTTTGAITFTPEVGFSGNPSVITYEVGNSFGVTTEAEVVVTFAPRATGDDSFGNAAGLPVVVDVLGNDLGDLDPATVKLVDRAGALVTELVVQGQGTWSVDPDTGEITFAPAAGFSRTPTPVEYEVRDTLDNPTRAAVVITFAPGAVKDESLGNGQGQPVVVTVLSNDQGDLDPATVRIAGPAGALLTELVVADEGTWSVSTSTGAITFSPEAGFSGNPTTITYEVDDTRGVTSRADVVVAFAPVAALDESLGNAQGEPVVVDVLGNDLGALDRASVRILDAAGDPAIQRVVVGEGTWTVDTTTGAVAFTPEATFSGNPTTIVYTVTDTLGNTARADVVVAYVPVAADDESLGNAQGHAVVVDVLGNDLGALDPTTVRILDAGNPVKELVVSGEGTWSVVATTGAITFTQAAGFSGNPTSIVYTVADVRGNSVQADVDVTFVPVATDDESVGNAQGQPVVVDVVGNDLGALDRASVRIFDAEGAPVTELVVDGEGMWSVNTTTGAITFTPEAGFSGNPTVITYEVRDSFGDVTTADVHVAFAPVAATDESVGNVQGQPVVVDVLGGDLGALDPTSVRILDGAGTPVTELVVAGEGTWSVDTTTGAITFTPEAGFSGNPTPIVYTVTDSLGNTTQADVVVAFAPASVSDGSLGNVQGQPVVVDVLGNDLGDLDPASLRILDGAGTPVTELVVAGEGTWTVDTTTGAITFTPEAGFAGNPTAITYEVSDTSGNTTQAQVTVTYAPAEQTGGPTDVPPAAPVAEVEPPAPAAPVAAPVTAKTGGALATTGAAVLGVLGASLAVTVVGAAFVLLRRRFQQA